jgi:predicted RNase H-like nuclease
MLLAGVDGCRGGWLVVSGEVDRPLIVNRVTEFPEVFDRFPDVSFVAVDIPIGQVEQGQRKADQNARELLKARRSSVFRSPTRPAVRHIASSGLQRPSDYGSFRAWAKDNPGHGLSAQCFNITQKIIEVDAYLQRTHDGRVYEVHPEVSFTAMNGGKPMRWNKKRTEGREERRAVLRGIFGVGVDSLSRPDSDVQWDDLYDALAALWTTARIARRDAQRIPVEPERDSTGLDMAIWY